MNPRTLTGMGVTAAAAAAVLCWYLLSREPDSAPRRAGKGVSAGMAGKDQTPQTHVSAKQLDSKPVSPWPKFDSPEFRRTLLERGQRFLEANGRSAQNLIAVWDLTRDKALLADAAEKFPHDAGVCVLMIQQAGKDVLKATPWIARLLAADPGNPQGLYLKASALIAGNDRAGAVEALRQAGAIRGKRDTHLHDRIVRARVVAMASEFSPADAARLAIGPFLQNENRSPELGTAFYAVNVEKEEAKAAGGASEARLLEITGIGLATVEKFSNGDVISMVDAMSVATFETRLLADLPTGTAVGDGSRPAVVLYGEACLRRDIMGSAWASYNSLLPRLASASDELVITYTDYFQNQGEFAAMDWLLRKPREEK